MRKRMVTRSITGTKVLALCLDVTTAEPFNNELILSGTYKSKKEIEKILRKEYETEDLRVAAVVSYEEFETLYGMEEQKFIELAEVLPPRKSTVAE